MAKISTLPPQAFDGQIFIDAFRVKWEFDGSVNCWKKIGICPDIPVASELQVGLLSSQLKQILDGIPPGGGHFGIVAQPLLSLVPQNPNIIYRDQVSKVTLTKSGTQLEGKSVEERLHTPEQFVGKVLLFKTGDLSKKGFLIFTNDTNSLFLEGDATKASSGDRFEIVDPQDLNPSGILLGDIMFVSNTIDITCVNGEGLPLLNDESCNLDIIQCDNVTNPPGLNFQLNQDFLDSLCVIIPGCQGSKGDRGDKGEKGADGTGDGPQGDQGNPGIDAPLISNDFTGIKIIDTDDIFDTAVVSMELDAENGKLTIIRAKVRTPDADTPATQLISTPINRSINFTSNESFSYQLMKPNIDPIDELDVDILKYPRGFSKPNGQTPTFKTVVNKIKLSDIINAVVTHYEEKLQIINNEYNQQLKSYIESKDEAARTILANLAQKVAECEFELPIDFCLGIAPSDCHPSTGAASILFPFPLAGQIFAFPTGVDEKSVMGTSLGNYFIPAFSTSLDAFNLNTQTTVDTFTSAKYPSNNTISQSATVPHGHYVFIINGGSAFSSESDGYIVGTGTPQLGLQIIITEGDEAPFVKSAPTSGLVANRFEKSSVELAYEEANFLNKIVAVELKEAGRLTMTMPMPGKNIIGGVSVEVIRLCAPDGSELTA